MKIHWSAWIPKAFCAQLPLDSRRRTARWSLSCSAGDLAWPAANSTWPCPPVNEQVRPCQIGLGRLVSTQHWWKKNVIFRIYVKIYQMNVGHTIGHVINFINDPRFDHKWLVTASTKKCFTTRREFQDGTTNPIRRKWWFPRLGEPTLKELMSGQWDLYPEMKVTMEPKQWFVLLLYVECCLQSRWLQHWSW